MYLRTSDLMSNGNTLGEMQTTVFSRKVCVRARRIIFPNIPSVGFDFALLEQNKARATVEEANAEAALDAALSGKPLPDRPSGPSPNTQTAMPSTSTKRTREQRIADLKRRRDEAKNGSSTSLAPSAEVDKLEKQSRWGSSAQ